MLKLCFYVPQTALEPVKEALFAAGAGRIATTSTALSKLGQVNFGQ